LKERGKNNYIEEPSSGPERTIHGQPECKVTPPGGGKVKLYSEIVKGKTTQKVYKLIVTSRDNQTGDTIKEMPKLQINPTATKVGIRSIRTLKDERVQIETGSNQKAETLTNSIRNKIGDKLETNIQRPRKPRLKIHNIPE
jgi:hypothetical protein